MFAKIPIIYSSFATGVSNKMNGNDKTIAFMSNLDIYLCCLCLNVGFYPGNKDTVKHYVYLKCKTSLLLGEPHRGISAMVNVVKTSLK